MATPFINARCTLLESYMEQKMGNELETENIYIYIYIYICYPPLKTYLLLENHSLRTRFE